LSFRSRPAAPRTCWRGIGQVLGRAWNQAVVVDNVPGAGGSVGAEKVAKAPAEVS